MAAGCVSDGAGFFADGRAAGVAGFGGACSAAGVSASGRWPVAGDDGVVCVD
jgi:hypothetical protein